MNARIAPQSSATTAVSWTVDHPSRTIGWRAESIIGGVLAIAYLLAIGTQQEQIARFVLAAAVAVSLASPVAGLAMFVIIMPMHETELLAPIRVDAIMSAAVTLGCLFRLPRDRVRLKLHPGVVLLLGYVAFSALSVPPAVSGHPAEWTSTAANQVVRLATGVGLFLSAAYLFQFIPSRVILGLALLGATLAALLAIGDFLNVPLESALPGLLGSAEVLSNTERIRAAGGFSDANYLGLFIAPAAVFVLSLLFVIRHRLRLLTAVVAILLLASLTTAFSRGSYLGFVAGTTLIIWTRNRKAAIAFVFIVAALAVTLYPAFLEARLGSKLDTQDLANLGRSVDAREGVAAAAIAMFTSSPIFGVGFGVFQFLSPQFIPGGLTVASFSHNQYLNILAEQGLVGALLVGSIVAALSVALLKSSSPLRWPAVAMGVAYLVLSFFINSLSSFQGSGLLCLVMAAALTPGPERTSRSVEV